MADMKKYLDVTALGTLVDKIKDEDAKVLAAAKKYTDDAGKLYDAAGSATTAESNAKSYADTKVAELANGAVATNTANIAKLNGDASTEGSVAKAVADAKALIDADVDAVDAKAVKNAEDIAAINNADTGILKQAKDYTDVEVGKVQTSVNNLDTFVGDIPEGYSETNVIAYIGKVAEETLAAATGDGGESAASVKAALDAYKAENNPKVTANAEAAAAAASAAAAAQTHSEGVDARVDVLVGDDANKSVRTIANEELAAQLIAENAGESLDTLKEIADWIQAHPGDASAMNSAITALQTLVGAIPEDATAETIVAYISELVAAEELRATQAENGLDSRITSLEGKFGEGEGSVEDLISDAQTAAQSYADAKAAEKATAAETAAKGYTDTEIDKVETRLDSLEAVDHSHKNFDLLETYTQTEADLADAVAKKHAHDNFDVLAAITAVKVTAWEAAEQNAKNYADGLNSTMDAKVDGAITRIAKNETDIATKAAQSDLEAAVARIATNETNIAANTSAISSFTPISSTDVEALFA